jgi:hypothetical protein
VTRENGYELRMTDYGDSNYLLLDAAINYLGVLQYIPVLLAYALSGRRLSCLWERRTETSVDDTWALMVRVLRCSTCISI